MFETLVTWAGLASRERVSALVQRLAESHPLLAAHLATESRLETPEVKMLRRQFLNLTESEHEDRKKLGAMGLAIVPSPEPEILRCLVGMLGDGVGVGTEAENALGKLPADITIPPLIKAWVEGTESDGSKVVKVLRKQLLKHQDLVTRSILAVWNTDAGKQARVAELVARLDQKGWFDLDSEKRPKMLDSLLKLSVDAESAGDTFLSMSLDALRLHASRFNLPEKEELLGLDFQKRIEELNQWHKAQENLAAEYAGRTDGELQIILKEGTGDQRAAAFDLLVRRRSSLAVKGVVGLAISNPVEKWLEALESLPREAVQQELAGQINSSRGKELEAARQLATLLEASPKLDGLAAIIQNSQEHMRAMALRSAKRAGPAGMILVFESVKVESSSKVIEAGLRVLAESDDPAILKHLLDFLFDEASRQSWPHRDGTQVETSENSYRIIDGWAELIHDILLNAGMLDSISGRFATLSTRGDARESRTLLDEARRLFPEPRALELLQRMRISDDEEIRTWALWSLSRAGESEAWSQLLRAELEAAQPTPAFTRDIAMKMGETVCDPAKRAAMTETCHAVLRSELFGCNVARKSFAVQLSFLLPLGNESQEWCDSVAKAALELMKSDNPSVRRTAVPALYRFHVDGEARVLTILFTDSDSRVRSAAYEIIAQEREALIEERFRCALTEGNTVAAHLIAEASASRHRESLREAARDMLVLGNCDQFVSAMQAIAVLKSQYDRDEEWAELNRLASEGFQRHGIEEAWKHFATNSAMLDEDHVHFVLEAWEGLGSTLFDHMRAIDEAAKIWPDNLKIRGLGILGDISGGRKEQAIARIQAFEKQFKGKFNHLWVGKRWEEVERYDDAIREFRDAIQDDPGNGFAHFLLAWCLFRTHDLDESLKSSRRAVELLPTEPAAFFNLGLALLASGRGDPAEQAYRRGVAVAKRKPESRQKIEGALGDFPLIEQYAKADTEAVRKIQEWLKGQCEQQPSKDEASPSAAD